jgi:uncharacterized membrane protein YGL010W
LRSLIDHLAGYAAYHRDRRNIATHFVGIPMIVVAIVILLSRPEFALAGLPLSPAAIAAFLAVLFYLALDRALGLVMAVLLGAALWLGVAVAAWSTATWLAVGIVLFVVGWALQFLGHYYEGRKPAFVDDLLGLLIGPLFVVAELGFAIGLRHELRDAVEARVGPTRTGPAPLPQS